MHCNTLIPYECLVIILQQACAIVMMTMGMFASLLGMPVLMCCSLKMQHALLFLVSPLTDR